MDNLNSNSTFGFGRSPSSLQLTPNSCLLRSISYDHEHFEVESENGHHTPLEKGGKTDLRINTENQNSDDHLADVIAMALEKVVDKKMVAFENLFQKLAESGKDKVQKQVENKDTSNAVPKEKKSVTIVENGDKTTETKKKDKKEPKEQKVLELSYKINCISDVDPVSCTFQIDIKVFMYWDDAKLIGRKNGEFIDYDNEKGLFEPDIIVTNDHDLVEVIKDQNSKIVDPKKGSVKRTMHFKGTVFLGSMDLTLFPFDCQNLQPYKLPKDELILESRLKECAIDRHIMHEWHVLGHCVKPFLTDPATSSTNKSYSTLFVTVLARRKYQWHINNVFIPTAAFLLISWVTFFFAVSERSEKNDLSLSMLLASLSNKFVVGDAIPKVDYRTLLDIYLDICFYLQMFTMVITMIVYTFHENVLLATILNWFFFIVEFSVTFLFHEWMYFKFLNHDLDISSWVQTSKLLMLDDDTQVEVELSKRGIDTELLKSRRGSVVDVSVQSSSVESVESVKENTKVVQLKRLIIESSESSRDILMQSLESSKPRRRVSSITKVIRAISMREWNKIRKYIDDGSGVGGLSAMENEDHFIHFGENQITKSTEKVVERLLLEKEQERINYEKTRETLSTLQLERSNNVIKRNLSKMDSVLSPDEIARLNLEIDEARVIRVQNVWRRKRARRKIQNIRMYRKNFFARRIQNCYRTYKRQQKLRILQTQRIMFGCGLLLALLVLYEIYNTDWSEILLLLRTYFNMTNYIYFFELLTSLTWENIVSTLYSSYKLIVAIAIVIFFQEIYGLKTKNTHRLSNTKGSLSNKSSTSSKNAVNTKLKK